MRTRNRRRIVGRRASVIVIALLLPLMLATEECPAGSKEAAETAVVTYAKTHGSIAIDERLRIHGLPERVPQGTVVQPYSLADPTPPRAVTCGASEGCWLFFIDTDHWAHFAHPTWLVLWDPSEGRKVKPVPGGWWPLVDGRPVFETVGKREENIVYPKGLAMTGDRGPGPEITLHPVAASPSPFPGRAVFAPPPAAPKTWGVLIAGYKDGQETFRTDVEAMEKVLTGHGVRAGRIYVLAPGEGDGAIPTLPLDTVRRRATWANINTVFATALPAAIEAAGGVCDEALVFFTSHGEAHSGNGALRCQGDECIGPDDCVVDEDDLAGWLDGIPCARVAVILEACQSGAFIDSLEPIPAAPVALEDGRLVTQDERVVMTSSSASGRSMRDRDRIEDELDDNPGDVGTETISGYIEAYGTSRASSAATSVVSVGDGFAFEQANDLSHKVGYNHPQLRPTPIPDDVVHRWPRQGAASQLKIVLKQDTPTAPADRGQLLRCRCNLFSLEVTSPGAIEPRLTTARLYWTTEPNPRWHAARQPHFKEVWDSTKLIPAGDFPQSHVVDWSVGSWIPAGETVTLLAVADSPDAPIRTGNLTLADFLLDNRQASAVKLEVVNPSSCFIFPCGCRTVRCEKPD